ncbi:Piwi domain-domain-containing protein [Catenaria anguillulae PL171]|uniref:Piwi domain-domain-containing protein n=1 Tax=Catenaria anguillulae PL171 TaxID=765915 RepID=A0A1Y2HJP6_9FUNG|nr:Piwi domain-domain-containing protein [Catenaria anguillulae PL171]
MPGPPKTAAQLQQEAQLAALTRAYSTPLAVPAPAVPVLPKVTDLIPELPPVPAGGYTRKEANKLFETLVQVPRRPSWCTTGEPVTVKANSVTIQLTNPDLVIHNYEFRLEPSITGPRLRDAFELWRREYLPNAADPGTHVTFDGKRYMYASSALYAIQVGQAREWQAAMAIGGGGGRAGRGGRGGGQQRLQRVVKIKVKLLGVLPIKDAIDYMQGIASREHSIFSYTGAVDNIFRTAATSILTPSGRVLYDRRQKQVTENGLEVVPGYTQAIRAGSDNLLLIVDVTSCVFYEPMPLSDLIKQAFNHSAKHSLSYHEQQQLRRALKNLNVYPTYVESSKRKKYAIQDITQSAADSTFFSLDGVNTSVADYFMREYNIRLQYPHLPCVIAKGGAASSSRARRSTTNDTNVPQIYLPLELCMLVPGQTAARSFGNIDHNKFKPSAMAPAERALMIERGLQQIYDPPMDILTAFGLQPTFQLQEIQGRMLEAPKLLYHPDSIAPTLVPDGGKWDMEQHKVYRGVTLERWAVLPFVPCDPIKVAKFIKQWAGRMRDVGIQVLDHQPPILPPADPEADIELAIQHAYLQAGREVAHPDLLVFILPNKGFALYHGIKRACDVTFGVASQCITLKTVQDARMLHIDNLCLKVNVKLPNGINVRMDPSYMPCVATIPTMFMGADVTHPAQEIRSPSIASVVGSMDAVGAKYACATRIQPIRMEIILDMGSMVLELLQKFYLQTGTKPQRIIFYRDGISEGQFTEVIRTEVTAIRKAFKALDPNYEPKLTFIIVQKRHHTRFFPLEGAPMDRLGNPMPGLLVDCKVTHPFEFDFYIQSHQTFQGLAKPTRYSVLVDDNRFDPNHLAELSYRSCFLYPRGTRSVSMVPAAFYAHVTAARAKAHVIDGERNGQRFFALSTIKPELEKAMYFM